MKVGQVESDRISTRARHCHKPNGHGIEVHVFGEACDVTEPVTNPVTRPRNAEARTGRAS
jgi:hypothetical protein